MKSADEALGHCPSRNSFSPRLCKPHHLVYTLHQAAREEEEANEKQKKKPGGKAGEDIAPEEEEVEIHVIEASGSHRNTTANKKALRDHSTMLRKLIDGLPAAPKPGVPQTLTIHEKDLVYERVKEWSVVQLPVIQRVVNMCQHSDCVEKKFGCEEKLNELQEKISGMKSDALQEFSRRREEWLEVVRKKFGEHEETIRKANENDFQHYIRHIKQAFNRRLHVALQENERRKQAIEDDVQLLFATQEARLHEVVEQYTDNEGKKLREDLEASQALAEKVFQGNGALKLAILAEVWQIDCLKDACSAMVRAQPMDYIECKEWNCPLIQDRYSREILPSMDVWSILRLQKTGPPANMMSSSHIDQEVNSRRKVLWEELRTLSNADLQAVVDQGDKNPWPDLVSRVVAERVEAKGSGALNTSLEVSHAKIFNNNSSVATTHPQRYVTVHGVLERASGGWGRHYFEVTLNELDPASGSTCCVGFDVKRESLNPVPIPGLVAGADGSYGASIQNDGFLNFQGRGEYIGNSFGKGATVGVGLDLSNNAVVFVINGIKVDCTKAINQPEIMLKEPFKIVPAATLFGARVNSHCECSFNFTGPFKFEQFTKPGGWEPIGDTQRR